MQEKIKFMKPAEFHLQDYKPIEDRTDTVHLLFEPSCPEKVLESRYFYIETYEMREDGFHVWLKVRKPDEVFSWLLSWGRKVKILEPFSLKMK